MALLNYELKDLAILLHHSSFSFGTNGVYRVRRSAIPSYLFFSSEARLSCDMTRQNSRNISSVISMGISAHSPLAAKPDNFSAVSPQPCRSITGRYEGVDA